MLDFEKINLIESCQKTLKKNSSWLRQKILTPSWKLNGCSVIGQTKDFKIGISFFLA